MVRSFGSSLSTFWYSEMAFASLPCWTYFSADANTFVRLKPKPSAMNGTPGNSGVAANSADDRPGGQVAAHKDAGKLAQLAHLRRTNRPCPTPFGPTDATLGRV